MGDWREKMGVFPSPPPRQRDWNNGGKEIVYADGRGAAIGAMAGAMVGGAGAGPGAVAGGASASISEAIDQWKK